MCDASVVKQSSHNGEVPVKKQIQVDALLPIDRGIIFNYQSLKNDLKTYTSGLSWGIQHHRPGVYPTTGVVNHPG